MKDALCNKVSEILEQCQCVTCVAWCCAAMVDGWWMGAMLAHLQKKRASLLATTSER